MSKWGEATFMNQSNPIEQSLLVHSSIVSNVVKESLLTRDEGSNTQEGKVKEELVLLAVDLSRKKKA